MLRYLLFKANYWSLIGISQAQLMLDKWKRIGYPWHVLVTITFFEMGVIFLVRLETTDIFRGAFLLASGGDLAEVRVRKNTKRIATFLITGKNLDRFDPDYRAGRALVNPV